MAKKATKSKVKTTSKPTSTTKKECTSCGDILSLDEFYTSWSWLNNNTKKMPICKNCTLELFAEMMEETKSNTRLAVYYTCRRLDCMYSESLYHSTFMSSEGDSSKVFRQYLKNINSLPQYKSKVFSDSDLVEEAVNTNQICARMPTPEDEGMKFKPTIEMRMRWGKEGKSNDDYYFLERQYNNLISCIDVEDPRQIMILEEICNIKLEADNARKSKKITDYDKLVRLVSTLMNDAGIKPKDDKTISEDFTYGEWIRIVEEEEPIPLAEGMFKDVDGIGKYIRHWFTKHFGRIFSIEKETVEESEFGDGNG